MKKPGRLLTAMVTPFDSEGKVDYQQAKNLAKALLNSGSDGLIISGTTGESPTLSHEEKLHLFSEVKSAIANRGILVAGTSNYNTKETQELTKEAEKIGVDACLLVVPYYNRPTQQGLFEHFSAIAQATTLPCILYNVPSRTVANLDSATVIKLSHIDNIVGVKEASGNFRQVAEIIQGTSNDFLVYSGNDGDTLFILALGGYGVISVASHLVGIQIKNMIEKFLVGETQEAASIHRHLLPLIDALFIIPNPMPVKYALNYLGFPAGRFRLPLIEPDKKSTEFIRTTLKDYEIDLPLASSR
ncbi:MAG: 4-hydroxy-tetrahydrodipicolinate synthase [Dehalococcoidia bacterium]|nr:4-hydroxy-tetrahydrodipicolinate synthase [Dehalococcoidia bacterium]